MELDEQEMSTGATLTADMTGSFRRRMSARRHRAPSPRPQSEPEKKEDAPINDSPKDDRVDDGKLVLHPIHDATEQLALVHRVSARNIPCDDADSQRESVSAASGDEKVAPFEVSWSDCSHHLTTTHARTHTHTHTTLDLQST